MRKKLIAALVLGAMLVAVGIGCSGSTPPAKTPPTEKKEPEKKPPP